MVTTMISYTLVNLFMENTLKIHGMLLEIISDQDPKSLNEFWTMLLKMCEIKIKLSTPLHPKTNGQIERTNRTIITIFVSLRLWEVSK